MATMSDAVAVAAKRESAPSGVVVRFDTHQRLQHFLMMSSFLVQAFTGIPQKFSTWGPSQAWVSFWGGMDHIRTAHHIGAYVMIFACVYHLSYIGYTTFVLKRPLPLWMIPSLKDVRDFLQDIRYFLGLSEHEPKFDRFNYREKFDYFAVFWGVPVLGITGFILMFPVLVSHYLPASVIPIALVAHSDEALLAVSWIFIVHFYFGHLSPKVFPINTSIFTGKVPKHRYEDEHPLEYARMNGAEQPEAPRPAQNPGTPPPRNPAPAAESVAHRGAPLVAPGADIGPNLEAEGARDRGHRQSKPLAEPGPKPEASGEGSDK